MTADTTQTRIIRFEDVDDASLETAYVVGGETIVTATTTVSRTGGVTITLQSDLGDIERSVAVRAVLSRAADLAAALAEGNAPICDECGHVDHIWAPGVEDKQPDVARRVYESATCWAENVCRECAPDLHADLLRSIA